MKYFILTLNLLLARSLASQSYDLFQIGDTSDAVVTPARGIVLMGGAGENDQAMRWFLQRANGGDVVVIRTSGGSGYQNYLYAQLGVPVNSVRTLVLKSRQHSFDPEVIKFLSRAEAIWIAGGNQATYINYWKDTPVDSIINHLYNVKGGVIGGISAGMAMLTGFYYSAMNASAESNVVLNNPFHSSITLGANDFIQVPDLQRVIGDSHLNNPDRRGRLVVFLSRLLMEKGLPVLGIGINEYCAVVINDSGLARAFGEYPQFQQDKVAFVRLNCDTPHTPETIQPGVPLTWNRAGKALKVFVAEADTIGSVSLNLNDWKTTSGGGKWEDWFVLNGQLNTSPNAAPPTCSAFSLLSTAEQVRSHQVKIYPNPCTDKIAIDVDLPAPYTITDLTGRTLSEGMYHPGESIDITDLKSGLYFLKMERNSSKFLKQ
ncbi:MAG: T9SS type A sorting domain-containing protein [Thermaurantimonas sp.]